MSPTITPGRPPVWSVPLEWSGARCFVLCTGESLKAQVPLLSRLKGRVIAVKHSVLEKPDADVLFLSGEGTNDVAAQLIPKFTGTYICVRGKADVPALNGAFDIKRITRSKDHAHWSELRSPAHVCGYDSGTSAINLAILFGATEVVVLGYDMQGGHFCKHPLPRPPEDHFQRHMKPLTDLAADAKAKGIRIVNCSPTSRVAAFEKQPLEAFL
jgi:hypothetical protein